MEMKKWTIGMLAVALIAGAGIFRVFAEDKPKPELITGSIQCLYCYMSGSDMGQSNDGCVERCINKNGMAPIIVQEGTGDIFVAVWKNGDSAVKKLTPLIGKKVNAQGVVYRKKGMNVLEIGIVAEGM